MDRGNEIHNTIAAAKAGVAPRVVQTVPDWDVFALEWLDARTMSNESLREAGTPSRIAAALRQLHAGPRFRDDFDMFRVAERYLALVDERLDPDPRRLSGASRSHPPDRGGARRPSAHDRPLPQRPPCRELPRRRRASVARRLGVQRQQRPGVRARQHRPGARLRRLPGRGAVRRLLRRGHPRPPRPDASPDDHVRRRLDAVGRHPGAHLDDRLRLHGVGRGALGAGRDRARRA